LHNKILHTSSLLFGFEQEAFSRERRIEATRMHLNAIAGRDLMKAVPAKARLDCGIAGDDRQRKRPTAFQHVQPKKMVVSGNCI
jgi:hypothetical protein